MLKPRRGKKYLTIEDVAAALGVHRATVWRYIIRGQLEALQPGNRAYLITRKALKEFQDKADKS